MLKTTLIQIHLAHAQESICQSVVVIIVPIRMIACWIAAPEVRWDALWNYEWLVEEPVMIQNNKNYEQSELFYVNI